MFIQLTSAQAKSLMKAIQNKTGYQLRLNKKQVASASDTEFEGGFPIPLLKRHKIMISKAKEQKKPIVLNFSASQISRKSGGFLGLPLVPMLLSLIPGLAGAMKPITQAFGDGYKNMGKLLGIGKGIDGLDEFAKDVFPAVSINGASSIDRKNGASLKIFGEGMNIFGQAIEAPEAKKKGRGKSRRLDEIKPNEVTY